MRALRLDLPAWASGKRCLLIAPDELTAEAVFGEFVAAGERAAVTDFDSLMQQLFAGRPAAGAWLPRNLVLAVVRHIIEHDRGAFDYLVGRHSVPRLTDGVLDRIARAMEAIVNQPEQEEQAESIVRRQLRLLARRVEERLAAGGLQQEHFGRLAAVHGLEAEHWRALYPDVAGVVFLDFDRMNEEVYTLAGRLARVAGECHFLLEFDPEREGMAAPSSEAAYMRLFEMADAVFLDKEEVPDLRGAEPVARLPVVFNPDSVAGECEEALRLMDALFSRAAGESFVSSATVVLSDEGLYLLPMERGLQSLGLSVAHAKRTRALAMPEWKLLQALAQTARGRVQAEDVVKLLKCPGAKAFVAVPETQMSLWDAATRLEHVLVQTGSLVGWKEIIGGVRQFLAITQQARAQRGHLGEEEKRLDQQMLEVLAGVRQAGKAATGKKAVRDWAPWLVDLLTELKGALPVSKPAVQHELNAAMINVAVDMALFDSVFEGQAIRFDQFISLYRTAICDIGVMNTEEVHEAEVVLCDLETASKLRPEVCLVLGCNDGSLPRFARPGADFLSGRLMNAQATARERQWLQFEKLLRSSGRTFLFMPAKEGTEELLPSQFVEELDRQGRLIFGLTQDVLQMLNRPELARRSAPLAEVSQLLKGVQLTEGELKRFARRGSAVYNLAHTASVVSARSAAELGAHDGVIRDSRLRKWVADWAARHIYSVSQLDAIVGCSFRFYVERMLNLEEVEEADELLPAHEFGSMAHEILSRFYRKWVKAGRRVPTFEDESLARQRLVEEFEGVYAAEADGLSPFAQDLLKVKLFGELTEEGFAEDERSLEDIADPGVLGQFLLMEMRRGSAPGLEFLMPAHFEVGFGMSKTQDDDPLTTTEPLELDLGEGVKIKLRGRIDRLDLAADGTFVVTDYKTGRVPEKGHILKGLRTQLPVYTLVANELLKRKFAEPHAAGGLYYSLRRSEDCKVSGVFLKAAYQKQAGVSGRSCLSDEAFDDVMDRVKSYVRQSAQSVSKGYLTTVRRDEEITCKYCSYAAFCYRNMDRTANFWNALEGEGKLEEIE